MDPEGKLLMKGEATGEAYLQTDPTYFAGKVTDQTGRDLADIESRRIGTWWGGSEGEIRNNSRASGNHISGFMHHWAEGDCAD